MKKMILIMILCLFSFNYSFGAKPVYIKDGTLYLREDIIKGETTRVKFSIEGIEISMNGVGLQDKSYFEVKNPVKSTDGFVTVTDLKVSSPENKMDGNGKVLFEKDGNNLEVELTLSGTFIFDWSKTSNNEIPESVRLEIGNAVFNENLTETLYLEISSPIKNQSVQSMKVKTIRDLHLGWGVAGDIFDSRAGRGQSVGGHSAEVVLEFKEAVPSNRKVELEVESHVGGVPITNGKDTMYVTLEYGDISGVENIKKEYDEDEFEVEFTPVEKIIRIIIDGRIEDSKGKSDGVYEGQFVLRVTYE